MTNPMYKCITMILICCLPLFSFSQDAETKTYSTVESAINAFYEGLSLNAEKGADFTSFSKLFTSDATITPLNLTDQGFSPNIRIHPLVLLAEFGSNLQASNANHKVISMKVEEYGRIAHAIVTSESEYNRENSTINERTVSSFQMINYGAGWQIKSMVQELESKELPIPSKYLK